MTDTKKMRGRPRKLDPDAAAQTAMTLFWQHGYDGVGVADLTQALGVKSPSLYAAFGSKANVFAAALEAYNALAEPRLASAFEAETVDTFTAELLTSAADFYTANPGAPGCLVLDGARNSRDPEAVAHGTKHREAFAASVRQKLSELGAQAPSSLADEILVAMIGLSGAARSGMQREDVQQVASSLAERFR